MSEKRRVFIVVKTYPTISRKYDELVCTAGILDEGSWVRIYPFPFRKLEYEQRYRKYQWITLPLSKNTSDIRPESYKVDDITQAVADGSPIGTGQAGAERKRIICEKNPIHDDLTARPSLNLQTQTNHRSLFLSPPKYSIYRLKRLIGSGARIKFAILRTRLASSHFSRTKPK